MSATPRQSGEARSAKTACGLGPKDEHAVTRASAAGAQPPSQHSCTDCGKGITIASIKKAVAQRYRLSELALLSRQNRRAISHPRQLAMALSRSLTRHSRRTIGHHFGDRHYTTVLHAERQVVCRYMADPALELRLAEILADLRRAE